MSEKSPSSSAVPPLGPEPSTDVASSRSRAARARARGAVILIVLSTAAAIAAIAVVWISQGSAREDDTTTSTALAALTRWEVEDRPQLDPFTARLLGGGDFASSQLAGQVAVINVWGSWCAPCREEAPDLVRVARSTQGEASFLGINVRDSPDAAQAFERSFEIPYRSIHPDDSASALLAFGGVLTSAAVPSTVVLDSEGRVAARVVGVVDETTLRALIEDNAVETSREDDTS